MFEKKKRSNLIFYGVRGEMRETQNDLITKVCGYNSLYNNYNNHIIII